MSFLSSTITSERFGVLIDIGSGSVLVAIVHSVPSNTVPTVVWSHREQTPLKNIESIEQSSKAVITSLINASLIIDSEGRKTLNKYQKGAKLTETQCTISAPWSFTITKNLNYSKDEPFEVTEELISGITEAIEKEVSEDVNEDSILKKLNLQTITRATMDMKANGYRVRFPEGEMTPTLCLSRATVITQKNLIDSIKETRDKLFPATSLKMMSFILAQHLVTRELMPQNYDVTLVDITYEATEIGVVRDGVLSYSTHTPFGSSSLAREISAITNVPLHEAFGYLHTESPYEFVKSLNKTKAAEIESMFESYTEKVSALLHETGDELAMPKQMSLHSDLKSETLFLDLVEKAAKRQTKISPVITPISKEISRQLVDKQNDLTENQEEIDTALMLSAQLFHKQTRTIGFEYL